MRVAFILQVPTAGGVSRFAKALVDGLLEASSDVEIGLFVDKNLSETEHLREHFAGQRVEVIDILDETLTTTARDRAEAKPESEKSRAWRWTRDALRKWRPAYEAALWSYKRARETLLGEKPWYKFALPETARARLADFDVVYLAFPYFLEPFECPRPVVGTFHDLNHLHFPENFSRETWAIFDRDLRYWTRQAAVVASSTHFIEHELIDAYPWCAGKTAVIYVAPYSVRIVSDDETDETLGTYGLTRGEFVVYPCNTSIHKNLGGYVQAAQVLKAQHPESFVPFVITGIHTETIGTPDATGYAAEVTKLLAASDLELGVDVLALGYVDDRDVDALTQAAAMVVSTSRYEAGCGPALDAWQFGVPVAFSAIPPFLEQLEALGVQALVFDPENPQAIASTLAEGLGDRETLSQMARASKVAIDKYSWRQAGTEYLAEFERARRDAGTAKENR